MGGVISKAANGIGGVIGTAFAAPIKTIFGTSYEPFNSTSNQLIHNWTIIIDPEEETKGYFGLWMFMVSSVLTLICGGVCSGPWDVVFFIKHLCVSDLVKLLMILVLCYIMLLFFYLLFKLGICQCIGRSLCKMCWAACETYWFALEDITYNYHHLKVSRKRKSVRKRRKDRLRGSLYPSTRHSSHSHNHHHVRLKTREVSVHVKGGSQRSRSLRHLQLSKVRNA
ncbi:uncharacterized protein LOC142635921 [Castanea sativa]|uniref:uncharacterized protein LOC142635921 n=1 Tax=Castanea sativa TaxID=21020 RepID=UPI003F64BF5E